VEIVKKINNKKIINGWAFYDWANSAYFLVISTAIFPSYFIANTTDHIKFFGFDIANSAFYSFLVSIAYVIIALTTPVLSGVADYSGNRKNFLKAFTVFGSLACISLFWFSGEDTMWVGIIAFVLATIGCAGSLVFYDSFLPDIASEDQYDKVSAKGYSYGYVGSVILLIFILFMYMKPQVFGIIDEALPLRIGFILVGLWWISFAQITFRRLPQYREGKKDKQGILMKGFQQIKKAYKGLKHKPQTKRYLVAFFFYFSGVQTVVYLASAFASKMLGFEAQELIFIILILQLIAVPGALLFAHIAKLKSNKFSMLLMIVIWTIICFAAAFVETKAPFYIIAGFVGLVLGGIQSMSRSTYSKMLDKDEEDVTCYYSFYDFLYKASVVFGTALFAILEIQFDDMRISVMGLAVLFVISFFILMTVTIKRESTIIAE
jgi:UMF1 family MFS transporter